MAHLHHAPSLRAIRQEITDYAVTEPRTEKS